MLPAALRSGCACVRACIGHAVGENICSLLRCVSVRGGLSVTGDTNMNSCRYVLLDQVDLLINSRSLLVRYETYQLWYCFRATALELPVQTAHSYVGLSSSARDLLLQLETYWFDLRVRVRVLVRTMFRYEYYAHDVYIMLVMRSYCMLLVLLHTAVVQ